MNLSNCKLFVIKIYLILFLCFFRNDLFDIEEEKINDFDKFI